MARAEFFTRLGLFVRRGFLAEHLCERLRREMLGAAATPATVWAKGGFVVDPGTRRTTHREVSPSGAALVQARLREVQPDIQRHFGVPLSGCREPGFLVYGPGDFYRPHRDNSGGPVAAAVAERRISTVVFLDSEAVAGRPGTYHGGALTFYELIDEPRLSGRGIPLEGEVGLMVAFPSTVVHGVASVTDGLRCTIVTWFLDGVMRAPA